jgi:hypothetical protein
VSWKPQPESIFTGVPNTYTNLCMHYGWPGNVFGTPMSTSIDGGRHRGGRLRGRHATPHRIWIMRLLWHGHGGKIPISPSMFSHPFPSHSILPPRPHHLSRLAPATAVMPQLAKSRMKWEVVSLEGGRRRQGRQICPGKRWCLIAIGDAWLAG